MYYESDLEHTLIEWLQEQGYDYALGGDISPDGIADERHDYGMVVLKDRLRRSLLKINKGLSAEAIDEAMRQVLIPQHASLILNNHAFHRLVTHGIDVQMRQPDGSYRTEKVWLFDQKTPGNNDFLAVNQLTIIENKHNRRPDVIIYVNGIPLVVIELKNPIDETATIEAAWNQLETYKNDIPSLMVYNSFLIISDGLQAKAGSLTASIDRYTFWKTKDGSIQAADSMPQLEVLAEGLLNKQTLIDIIHNFVMFQSDGKNTWKILSAYQQYYAVNKAVQNAHRASASAGDRRIGVIWHTTGSGKSFTMAFFTGKLIRQMNNPTVIVITDRNDLDDQLFTTFCHSAELLKQTPEQALTRADLRQKLMQRQSGGIIFTTIQKFEPDNVDSEMVLNGRQNIIVIADEAHRSQYGFDARVVKTEDDAEIKYGYARYLHNALPQASFIGFTGTPVETKDKNTPAVFGDYIDIYDMSQSIEDKVTVPIYYESRLAKLSFPEDMKPIVDDDFEDITEYQEDSIKEQKKAEWSQLEKVVGSEQRVELVAQDLVTHFEQRQSAIWGKAMIVCMSRRICVEMYDAIINLRPNWHDDDDSKGKIKVIMTGSASDPKEFQPHIHSAAVKKQLANRMKDPKDPLEIVIVRDMWLTGFDVPFLHTMYIDKPMSGHNLIQAISRVNRVYKDKPGGLIVDYIGFAQNLKEALTEYSPSDRDKTGIDPHVALDKLKEILEKLDVLLHGHSYKKFFTGSTKDKLAAIAETVDFIIKNEEDKKEYKNLVLELGTAYALCKTLDEVKPYDELIGFHKAIKAGIVKLEALGGQGRKTITELDREINQLVSRSVISDQIVDILAVAGMQKQDISILSDEFLDEIKKLPYKNLALEALKRLLAGQIRSIGRINLVQSRKFSDMLQDAINRYTARSIDTLATLQMLLELAKHVRSEMDRGKQLGLSPDEIAFYDALSTNKSAVDLMGDAVLKQIATELAGTIRNNLSVDWTIRENVQARMRVIIKRLLKKYKYPPDASEEAVRLIMEQAKQMCESEIA
jgi:type I restriction enzyme, R subunit